MRIAASAMLVLFAVGALGRVSLSVAVLVATFAAVGALLLHLLNAPLVRTDHERRERELRDSAREAAWSRDGMAG